MAILKCYEFGMDREASNRLELDGQSARVVGSISRLFWVETSADTVGAESVINAVDPTTSVAIPNIGSQHPTNPWLFCVEQNPRQMSQSFRFWTVSVRYESIGTGSKDPLAEPVEESWDSETVSEPVDVDALGNPIVNAVGEPYDTPLTRNVTDKILTVSWNVASLNWDYLSAFEDSLNNSDISLGGKTWKRYQGYCRRIVGHRLYRGAYYYYRIAVQFAFRSRIIKGENGIAEEKGWRRVVFNKGFSLKVSASSSTTVPTIPILDQHGQYIRKPAFLSADGTQVVSEANATRKEYRLEKETNFAQLLNYTGA